MKCLDKQRSYAPKPLLHFVCYEIHRFEEVLVLHNEVMQGLSSCIFTNDVREAEQFISTQGSDCGIANINIGPSGAELAVHLEVKETGGGRGSDRYLEGLYAPCH